MQVTNHGLRWLLLARLVTASTGCKHGADLPHVLTEKDQEPVVAFVAASTVDAVKEIAAAFSNETKAEIKINADDSSKLAMQIGEDATGRSVSFGQFKVG